MNNNVLNREHFNLYYIFLEDKQNNMLSNEKAADLFNTLVKRKQGKFSGHSPPIK